MQLLLPLVLLAAAALCSGTEHPYKFERSAAPAFGPQLPRQQRDHQQQQQQVLLKRRQQLRSQIPESRYRGGESTIKEVIAK